MENRLREIRKSLGLSGEKLAEIAGTTKATISRLEKGERRLSDHWIERITNGLHVAGFKEIRPADFFQEPMVSSDLLMKLKQLSEKQQAAFEAMVDSMIKTDKGK